MSRPSRSKRLFSSSGSSPSRSGGEVARAEPETVRGRDGEAAASSTASISAEGVSSVLAAASLDEGVSAWATASSAVVSTRTVSSAASIWATSSAASTSSPASDCSLFSPAAVASTDPPASAEGASPSVVDGTSSAIVSSVVMSCGTPGPPSSVLVSPLRSSKYQLSLREASSDGAARCSAAVSSPSPLWGGDRGGGIRPTSLDHA